MTPNKRWRFEKAAGRYGVPLPRGAGYFIASSRFAAGWYVTRSRHTPAANTSERTALKAQRAANRLAVATALVLFPSKFRAPARCSCCGAWSKFRISEAGLLRLARLRSTMAEREASRAVARFVGMQQSRIPGPLPGCHA